MRKTPTDGSLALSHIPEDLRVAYKVLKNSNMIDETNRLREEVMTIEKLIDSCDSSEESERLKMKKSEKKIWLEALLKKRKALDSKASAAYKEKVLKQFEEQHIGK